MSVQSLENASDGAPTNSGGNPWNGLLPEIVDVPSLSFSRRD